jgi:hypothetical protein
MFRLVPGSEHGWKRGRRATEAAFEPTSRLEREKLADKITVNVTNRTPESLNGIKPCSKEI